MQSEPWDFLASFPVSASDVSRNFLRIPFSVRDFRAGTQKDIIVNFEE